MNDDFEDGTTVTDTPAAAAPVHADPKLGGSFTRDISTGDLVNNDPAVAAQPDQE